MVEGECDRLALAALLSAASTLIGQSLTSGRLGIEVLGGADKLPYFATLVRNALCSAHAFLDYDQSGKQGARAAQGAGSLNAGEITFASARGAAEAEIEDMYRLDVYAPRLRTEFGVQLPSAPFQKSRSKWSGRMAAAFADPGKDWDTCSAKVKHVVAEEVAARPADALHDAMRGPFDSLVASLELRLERR